MVAYYAKVSSNKSSHAMMILAAQKRIVPSSLGKSGKVAMPMLQIK
jgi:hypothetical protein